MGMSVQRTSEYLFPERAGDGEVRRAADRQCETFDELGCEVEDECPDFSHADEVFRVLRAMA
jgi:hypothetical protein